MGVYPTSIVYTFVLQFVSISRNLNRYAIKAKGFFSWRTWMHSSRMRTARSPTVLVLMATTRRQYREGGWGGCVLKWTSLNRFLVMSTRCLCVWGGGRGGRSHVSPYILGKFTWGPRLPGCGQNGRQADTCENITFLQLRNEICLHFWNFTRIVQAYMCLFYLVRGKIKSRTHAHQLKPEAEHLLPSANEVADR